MTKQEYENLKYGDIITQCAYGGYYIVHEIFDDDFIDCQDISDVGVETEFGFNHVNWEYKYCTKIDNPLLIKAVMYAVEHIDSEERNLFIDGAEWAIKNLVK